MQEMFTSEIKEYEEALKEYENTIGTKVAIEDLRARHEIARREGSQVSIN